MLTCTSDGEAGIRPDGGLGEETRGWTTERGGTETKKKRDTFLGHSELQFGGQFERV